MHLLLIDKNRLIRYSKKIVLGKPKAVFTGDIAEIPDRNISYKELTAGVERFRIHGWSGNS